MSLLDCNSSLTVDYQSSPQRRSASQYRTMQTADAVSPPHAVKPRSGRRRRHLMQNAHFFNLQSLLLALLCSLLWCSPCVAAAISLETPIASLESVLLFDRSPPPQPPIRLIRRVEDSTSSSSSAASTTVAATLIGSSTTSTSTSEATSPLPSPFDTSLGNNFTAAGCPAFFKSFLSNSTFHDCLPLSLLLQVRNSLLVFFLSLLLLL